MLTGHELTEAAALMRAKRERVVETNSVELDRTELEAMRAAVQTAIEEIAVGLHQEMIKEISQMEARWNPVMEKLLEAAEKEIERKARQNG